MHSNPSSMEQTAIAELNSTFISGATRTLQWRETQLKSLLRLLTEKEADCFHALNQDLGKSKLEAFKDEVGPLKKSIDYTLTHLKGWMSPKKAGINLLFFPAKGKTMPEPYGVVLVIAAWNLPLNLALEPVIGAIAAGNAVVLKPSELAPATSSLLAELIPQFLDSKAIKVVEGGVDVSQQLLQRKWDKIFYTGSARVGKLILAESAKHLTPVALELGGKSPAIFDFQSLSSNVEVAVKRVASGKWGTLVGQACLAIDYLLVEEKFASALIDLLKKTIKKFYGESLNKFSRVASKCQLDRLQKLLKDPAVADTIVYGGSVDEEALILEPTILLNPPLDAEVMTEEIFGPILPIITLNNISDSIGFINSRPKPLVIYGFTDNKTLKRSILNGTSSGGVLFNDVLLHFLCDELPFGGVGSSGMGRYHGKYSFDTFSHEKAVLDAGYLVELEARYPPWNSFKMAFVRTAYKLDYIGLLLLLIGLKRYPKVHKD
ncbi:hypothetical protein Drorol1_Dr00005173 [Drosera rotundifolia]